LPGDVLVLGAGGKMGPSLCRMARRAAEAVGSIHRIIAVSRFRDDTLPAQLEADGIEVIQGDLLDRDFVATLPQTPLVVSMSGQKFGTTGAAATTWAINTLVPANICEHFAKSKIVAFSTGNVYGLMPVSAGRGSRETSPLEPVGEYAMAALGRERTYEYFSRTHGTKLALIRLNYAVELRYGVLVDIARAVWNGQPIPLAMGYANVIWQADASAMALASLAHATSPPFVLNVTGAEVLCCRDVANRFGELFGVPISFNGEEAPTALLNDASQAFELFGVPRYSPDQIMAWIADWIKRGGALWDKPTHFESREGRF
jgi:hypothetical protein